MRVGCDLVAVDRIARALTREGFAARVFTERELGDATRGGLSLDSPVAVERLAARFAAKEAARKALGDLGIGLRRTELVTDERGAPQLWLDGRPSQLAVSVSHDGGLALAVVVDALAGGDRRRDKEP